MRLGWVALMIVVVGCGGHHSSSASRHSTPSRSAGAQQRADPGVLRGVRFASTPVVLLGSCRVKDQRKCFQATYEVYARLDRGIPRRQTRVRWAAFAIEGSRWVDPIKHPPAGRTCFTEALFSNDPKADHLPTSPGTRVRLRFQVFASQCLPAAPVGEISAVVRVRSADNKHAPGASPAALHAVGC